MAPFPPFFQLRTVTGASPAQFVLLFFLLVFLLSGFGAGDAVAASKKPPRKKPEASMPDKEVRASIVRLANAYVQRDLKKIMALYEKGPRTVAVGSNTNEKCIGYDAVKNCYERDLAAVEDIKAADIRIISIASSGRVAWILADGTFTVIAGGQSMAVSGRLTAVLHKKDRAWLFAQTHFSVPANVDNIITVTMTFEDADTNKDGKVDYREMSVIVTGLTPEMFRKLDKNGDGFLDPDEYGSIRKR